MARNMATLFYFQLVLLQYMRLKQEQILHQQSPQPNTTQHQNFQLLHLQPHLHPNQSQIPAPTAYHAMAYYDNKLYVWGGRAASIIDNHHASLYVYDLQSCKWSKIITKCTYPGLESLSSTAHTIHNHKWYFFGGTNQKCEYNTALWKLNVDNYEWKKCEQKGELPPPTEGGNSQFIDKSWMLHYEGFNSVSPAKTQFIYLYNIDTKIWHKCEGNYLHYVRFRIGTSICIQNDTIYMFGGAYQQEDQLQCLNDLYSLKVWLPSKNNLANVEAQLIRTNFLPPPTYLHTLLPLNTHLLLAIGGLRQEQTFLSKAVWIFNTRTQQWLRQEVNEVGWLQRYGSSCAVSDGKIYGFGGMDVGLRNDEVMKWSNDLWQFTISDSCKYLIQNVFEPDHSNSCVLCYQRRNNFAFGRKAFSKATIDNLTQMMQFPFAAFGLLIDNALINDASSLQISIQHHHQALCIKLEDLSRNDFTTEQLISSLISLGSQHSQVLLGCDKKIKKTVSRQNACRQFGVNLALGCLRLGKSYLYVSVVGQFVRVCLCEESKQQQSSQMYYYIYYYEQSISKSRLVSQQMRHPLLYVESQYKQLIKEIVKSRSSKNVLYIFNTILDSQHQNLNYLPEKNDIYYGKPEDIQKLAALGYPVSESIDISLKAYLSMLYLKHDKFTITIASKQQSIPIYLQTNLEKVDRLVKAGLAVELDGAIEFDFKLAEFYYLKDMRRQYAFFNNGVVFYHKNRLITRHRPPLGQMIPFILGQANECSNILPLFGYAELSQNITVNPFKTDFSFGVMLERLLSRIKFVQEYLRAKEEDVDLKRQQRRNRRQLMSLKIGQKQERQDEQRVVQGKVVVEDEKYKDRQQRFDGIEQIQDSK